MSAATFLALDRASRDALRHHQQIAQIECGMPAVVVHAVAVDADVLGAALVFRDLRERLDHLILAARDTDQVLHHILQLVLDLIRRFGLSCGRLEWMQRKF